MLRRMFFSLKMASLMAISGYSYAELNAVTGYWATPESIIEIEVVGESLSMKVVALLEPYYTDKDEHGPLGSKKRDADNPDPTLRDRFIIGLELLGRYKFHKGRWAGEIYDPETAQVYLSFIEVGRRGKLKIRGYIGASILGRTQWLAPLTECNQEIILMLQADSSIPNPCSTE